MPLCPTQDASILPPAPASLCRDADFTWAFHLAILQILPAAVYVALCAVEAWSLQFKPKYLLEARFRDRTYLLKLAAPSLLALASLVRLLVFLLPPHIDAQLHSIRHLLIPALVLRIAAALALVATVHFQYRRQPRPSTTNVVFLAIALIFDAAFVRTLALSAFVSTSAFALSVLSVAALLACLFVECLSKRALLIQSMHARADAPTAAYPLTHAARAAPSRAITASVLSRAAHLWLLPTVWRGRSQELVIDHLEQPDDPLQVQADIDAFQRRWSRLDPARAGPNALAWTVLATFRTTLLRPVLPKLLFIAVSFAQPFLIERTTAYLQGLGHSSSEPSYHGWGLVAAYALVYALTALLTAHYQSIVDDSACKIRRTLVSIIYQKSLRLRQDAALATGAGGATTLISADMERVCNGVVLIHEVWASLLQIAIALWLAYEQISYAFLVPVVMTVISIVLTTYISNRMRAIVVRWTKAMQLRVKLVTATMKNITSIKLASRFAIISERLSALRALELAAFRAAMWIATLLVVAANDLENYTTLLTLVAFSGIAQNSHSTATDSLDTTKLFTVISVLTLLRNPLFLLAQYGPMLLAALGASVGIRDFLLQAELVPSQDDASRGRTTSSSSPSCSLDPKYGNAQASNAAASSVSETSSIVSKGVRLQVGTKALISDLNFTINKGQLACLTGATGTGKSSLLLAFLGELRSSAGELFVERSPAYGTAYCAQSTWLQDASIRDNILFHSDLDQERYDAVVWCLDLEQDFAAMPEGDGTRVGPQGSKLSGGQKSRVALARALYSSSPLLLLDDSLAALDASTTAKIVSRLLAREPQGRDGSSVAPARLVLGGRTVVLACHKFPLGIQPDVHIALSSKKETAETVADVIVQYASHQTVTFPPYSRSLPLKSASASSDEGCKDSSEASVADPSPNPRTQLRPWEAFKFYCRTCGTARALVYVAISIFAAASLASINIYLYFWSNANDRKPNASLWAWIGGYAAVVTVNSLALTGQVYYLFIPVAQACARRMHSIILSSTLAAPLSYFLNTSGGAIVNRFSQDLFVSDNDMTKALFNVSSNLGVVLGSMILLSLASPWFLLILPVLLPTLWAIKSFYLRTSGQVRKLDLESKSPLYTLFGETIDGIVTIRAFGGGRAFTQLNEILVSRSQRAFFLNLSLMRWLTLVSGLIVAGLSTAFCSLSVGLAQRSAKHGAGSDTVGWVAVGLTQLMMLTSAITMLTKAWTQLELCLVAIERLQQVATLEAENDDGTRSYEGESTERTSAIGAEVVVESVNVGYTMPDSDVSTTVLRDLSFTLAAGEKAAVVGRTGSGKSSLIQALLRFVPLSSGSISIEGVDTTDLRLRALRERILVLPQEAVVVSCCTLRENLLMMLDTADSVDVLSDSELWDALKRVGLDAMAAKWGGLDAALDQADELSNGQRQLLSLAQLILACKAIRARHGRSRIGSEGHLIVLDEPTSFLDDSGDALLRELMQDPLALGDFTVLMISHRFGPILACDKVLLLHKHGEASTGPSYEFGPPRDLFYAPASSFGLLARDAGITRW